jgi:hypothetical protein
MMDNLKEFLLGAVYVGCTIGALYVTLILINKAIGVTA